MGYSSPALSAWKGERIAVQGFSERSHLSYRSILHSASPDCKTSVGVPLDSVGKGCARLKGLPS